jgi:hypothetical protein
MSDDDLTLAVEACTERAVWPIKNARRSAKPAFELEDIGPYLDPTNRAGTPKFAGTPKLQCAAATDEKLSSVQ